jgi:hypothetical protein
VNALAVGSQHRTHLGNEINKLLELLFRTLALGDVDHRPHELTEIARAVEDRMAYDVNVPDPFVRMNESVLKFEIRLVADGFLVLFADRSLVVWMKTLKEGFESR